MSDMSDMGDQILALWAVPRSTSTAFEWMMRTRGDMQCFHEPFGEAWYQGEEPLWPRVTAASLRTPGLTFDSVWQTLTDAIDRGPVFIKEFPLYIESLWTDEFLANFRHSFLIRDPLKTLTSMYRKWPDFDMKETGFVEQRELFDRLTLLHGRPPPLIDSDDLLQDPVGIVQRWCDAVEIPFVEQALSWEPGARDEVSWWDGGSFHATLRDSDGLKPQEVYDLDIADAPHRIQEAYELLIPHYRHMYQYRMTAVRERPPG